jgi:BarA-like signal transduction histidine kinase
LLRTRHSLPPFCAVEVPHERLTSRQDRLGPATRNEAAAAGCPQIVCKGKTGCKDQRGALEVIVVGGSLKDTSAAITAHKAPVEGRHMRSIDDLLAYIEDHEVDVAVVDQSKPTESRGLKLALLAAAKRIKHLIVIADPKNAAEAEAIYGVHEVIRAPVSDKRLLDAVITHACTASAPEVHPSMKRMVKRTGMKEVIATPPEPLFDVEDGDAGHADLLSAETRHSRTPKGAEMALDSLSGKMRQLAIPHHNRALLAALVPLFAVFICFGGIVAFFFVSNGWSVPVELGRNHELVRQAGKQLEDLRSRHDELQSALDTASTLAAMAETTRTGKLHSASTRRSRQSSASGNRTPGC